MQVFNINEHVTSDIYFNDLYYYKYDEDHASDFMKKQKEVVLVNTQDIGINERYKYKELLTRLLKYNPKCIGVDVTFNKNKADELKDFHDNKKIVFVQGAANDIQYPNVGNAEFPKVHEHNQRTIRFYSNSPKSFAYKLAHIAYPTKNLKIGSENEFLIHFNAINNGISHIRKDYEDKLNYSKNFHYMNSQELVEDSLEIFKEGIENKIVIIGYLGDQDHFGAKYDIEDKFRIPADTKHLINKEPVMNGAVIHAVAISNMLNPSEQFTVIPDFWIRLFQLLICCVFLVLLLFYQFGKLLNRFLLFALSIPLLFLVLFLMDHLIFVKLGGTLFALLIIEEMFEILEPFEHKYFPKLMQHEKK